jgi:signal transduction histidine kinase
VELLENGVAHNPDPEPVVEVVIEQVGDTVTVAVRDEGPGIPEQDRAVVAGRQEVDALFHASGLGLWYVYWVVRNLGGEVSFADREPTGSEVRLTLQRAADGS